jgi:hypothetical protein
MKNPPNDPVYQALEPDVKGTRPITVQFEKYQVTIISLPFKSRVSEESLCWNSDRRACAGTVTENPVLEQ